MQVASIEKQKVFGLVHGAWHGSWCWQKLQPLLESAGHKTVAVDLPIDNPEAGLADYVDAVVSALHGHTNVTLVGHSRAGNVIPRVAHKIAVERLVYLCAALPAFEHVQGTAIADEMPVRNTPEFRRGIIKLEHGMTEYDRSLAAGVFYNECEPADAEWAVSRLRKQRATSKENKVITMPDVAQTYMYGRSDLVIYPEYSRYVSAKILGAAAIELPGDHSPFLSCETELAQELLRLD